ncbi:MAG: MarR family transcriptional regulator, partial [Muribaculaceae bacterium]|nr:MarR family transcriptional regulator [Muribaculaceae bacterium]
LRFFKLAKLSENGGYGIDKINEWKQLTGSEVTINSSITYSEVKFLMPISAKKDNVALNGTKSGTKNGIETQILALIEANKSVTIAALIEATKIPRRTLSRILEDMKNRGILIRHGSARAGYWEIVKP